MFLSIVSNKKVEKIKKNKKNSFLNRKRRLKGNFTF